MSDNRERKALNYDPAYFDRTTPSEYFGGDVTYNQVYEGIKTSNDNDPRLKDRPKPTPHHIRGLNNWSFAWKYLTPENQDLMQSELQPYGLFFGNDPANLVHAEGRFSRSRPGKTASIGKGGLHHTLHDTQERTLQEMGFDRSRGMYVGVNGVPWSQMTQDQIMGFLRTGALADEMTVNRTLSTGLSLRTSNGSVSIDTTSAQQFFPNRLTAQPQPVQQQSTDAKIWDNFLETTRPKSSPIIKKNGSIGLDMGNRLTGRQSNFRGTAGPIGTGVNEAFNTPYNINESDPLGGSTYMPEVEAPLIKGV